MWIKLSDNQDDHLANKWKTAFDDEKKCDLNEWLLRLEQASDFKKNQKNLASIVCQMIQAVIDHPPFSIAFWDQIKANNECCGDRAAMALNELYTSYKIHTLPADSTLKDQLQIIERAAKTLALRRILATLISQKEKKTGQPIRESVEIFLYYESKLQKKLNLLTAVKNMEYSEIGKRDWIDPNQLIEQVRRYYLGDLTQILPFQKIIEADSKFQNDWSPKEDIYTQKLTEEENRRPINCSENDTMYLNWFIKMTELGAQKEQEKRKLMRQWFIDHR